MLIEPAPQLCMSFPSHHCTLAFSTFTCEFLLWHTLLNSVTKHSSCSPDLATNIVSSAKSSWLRGHSLWSRSISYPSVQLDVERPWIHFTPCFTASFSRKQLLMFQTNLLQELLYLWELFMPAKLFSPTSYICSFCHMAPMSTLRYAVSRLIYFIKAITSSHWSSHIFVLQQELLSFLKQHKD